LRNCAANFRVSAVTCPICNKPSDEKYKPFCCKRCADIDLNRWFKGSYAVPAVENEDEPDEEGDETTQ